MIAVTGASGQGLERGVLRPGIDDPGQHMGRARTNLTQAITAALRD